MKKIIGILGVTVIAATMFFVSNNIEATEGVDLASLISLASANAETIDLGNGQCITCGLVSYDVCVTVNYHEYVGYRVWSNC